MFAKCLCQEKAHDMWGLLIFLSFLLLKWLLFLGLSKELRKESGGFG